MRFWRWIRRLLYPMRYHEILGVNEADLYMLMSPGDGIQVKK